MSRGPGGLGRWVAGAGFWAALAGACSGPVVQEHGPAHAYLAAVATGDPDACDSIGDPDLRGECVVFGVQALAAEGHFERAEAVCQAEPAGLWRDECWFTLSDAVDATGRRAHALCGQAGRFEQQCFGHVISRDSQAILGGLPVGEEPRALDALRQMAVGYIGAEKGTARARQNMRKALGARFRHSGEDGHRTFEPGLCGAAPPELCAGAYAEIVTFAATHDERGEQSGQAGPSGAWRLRQVCEGPRTVHAVIAQGFPGWTPDAAELAEQAWDEICRRTRGRTPGRKGPVPPGTPPTP